jgi:hypothetical protein
MFKWFRPKVWRPVDARACILQGKPPASMLVDGDLSLAGERSVQILPEQLTARNINLARCTGLRTLPAGLSCSHLSVRRSSLETLPAGLQVERIDAEGCRRLRKLGALDVEELNLRGCTALEYLPAGLHVRQLDLSCCPLWGELPASVLSSVEVLDVSQCPQLTQLPGRFARLQGLNVADCPNLRELPEGLRVRSWIDVGNSGLSKLPLSCSAARLLWHGVPVTEQVAFDPQTITVEDILKERNQELRRVLLERVGLDWFFEHARPTVLDEDRDRGGVRRLLRIEMGPEEVLVCVEVQCPSTGGRYLLRVPPELLTCHEAVAWTAGFANPDDYRPVIET